MLRLPRKEAIERLLDEDVQVIIKGKDEEYLRDVLKKGLLPHRKPYDAWTDEEVKKELELREDDYVVITDTR